jgi:hypothetical protein
MLATIADLTKVELDTDLLERVPLGLCRYHQVLPLAREDGRVSVAMVYPHNTAAREMLAGLLDAEIVSVQIGEAALQETFQRLMTASPDNPPHILLHAPGVDDGALLVRLARMIAAEEGGSCALIESPEISVAAALAAAGASHSRLAALPMADAAAWGDLVLRTPTSLLLAAADAAPIAHLLVVLRGHGADVQALTWGAAIAVAETAALTLLVLTEAPFSDLQSLLDPESPTGRHLATAVKLAMDRGVEPRLRLRQGDCIHQIVEEVATRRYDMVALCAERHGEFASAVMRRLSLNALSLRALLLCKPDSTGATLKTIRSNKRRIHRA